MLTPPNNLAQLSMLCTLPTSAELLALCGSLKCARTVRVQRAYCAKCAHCAKSASTVLTKSASH